MKKVLLSLLTIVLLGGCNRGVISSNISASISSSTTISSSSSSDKEISIPEKTSKDYLQSALSNFSCVIVRSLYGCFLSSILFNS